MWKRQWYFRKRCGTDHYWSVCGGVRVQQRDWADGGGEEGWKEEKTHENPENMQRKIQLGCWCPTKNSLRNIFRIHLINCLLFVVTKSIEASAPSFVLTPFCHISPDDVPWDLCYLQVWILISALQCVTSQQSPIHQPLQDIDHKIPCQPPWSKIITSAITPEPWDALT